jgi:ribosomal protein S18 acetylase RimI-like enzyme
MAAVIQAKANTSSKPQVVLRKLTQNDLRVVAETHLAVFSDSGLTMLGLEAVRRYYDWQLNGPHDVTALGAYVEGKLAGFCFGGIFRGATSGFLSQNRNYLAWRVLTHPWLLVNPVIRDRINLSIRLLRKPVGATSTSSSTEKAQPDKKPFGILAIAVHPKKQGLGIGKLLMLECENIARRQNFMEMDLTVHVENHQAIAFYESLSFERCEQDGDWKGWMKKTLCA